MKVYSWNIWFRNKHFDRAFEYIKTLDFDVLCLQEVPEDFLNRLKTLPYFVCAVPEGKRLVGSVEATHYGVIVSKYAIETFEPIPFPSWDHPKRFRSRVFVAFMAGIGVWSRGIRNRSGMYADIKTPRGTMRVFNLHFALLSPKERSEEFVIAMRYKTPDTIVAGDFNIVESPKVSILNWFLGGTLADSFFWKRERRNFEVRLAKEGFQNPLRGTMTHAISRSQLDHVLVPLSAKVVTHGVVHDAHGSDHRPVFVEFVQ